MNIVLIGMSGAGKTTIGKNLSRKLDYSFFDTDELVVDHMEMSIDKIFERYGEKKFRSIEEKVIRDISSEDKSIISTGGGSIINKGNIKNLKMNGRIVFLEGEMETLIGNLKKSHIKRPLLTSNETLKSDMRKIYKVREDLYRNYADIVIKVDGRTIEDISNDIIERNKNVES